MNEKIKTAFSGKKAGIVSITLCAVLILTAGTLTVLAATNERFLPFFDLSSEEVRGLSVRSDDNGTSHSTDGGETWSDTAPEGVAYTEVTTEDGDSFEATITIDAEGLDSEVFETYLAARPASALPFDFSGLWEEDVERRLSSEGFEYLHMLRVDIENDTLYHSLDGGETWIEGLPEGMTREGADEYTLSFDSEDGSVSFRHSVTIDD